MLNAFLTKVFDCDKHGENVLPYSTRTTHIQLQSRSKFIAIGIHY